MTIASRHIHIILPLVAKSNFLLSGMEKMDVNSIQRDHLCTKFWGDLQQFITTHATQTKNQISALAIEYSTKFFYFMSRKKLLISDRYGRKRLVEICS
uniref:hypothetical protein n=1 Tax=Vibrio anguillarum TaxID=55601 RepID=UPI001BE4153E